MFSLVPRIFIQSGLIKSEYRISNHAKDVTYGQEFRMKKEVAFASYIKQIERSDSILRHSTFVIRYSAVQNISRMIASPDTGAY